MTTPPLSRRAFLRAGAGAVLAASLPLTLDACGDGRRTLGPHDRAVARRSIGIDYASYYPPVQDIQRLVRRRASLRGAAVTFSHDPSGAAAQLANLRRWSGDRGGFGAVVVAPFDSGGLADVVKSARDRDVAIVSYLSPIRGQTAAISVDAAGAGRRLASAALTWAARQPGGRATALIVGPSTAAAVPDPFAALADPAERGLRGELSRAGGVLTPVATAQAADAADARIAVSRALAANPGVRAVLCWSDLTALGAAQALRERHGQDRGFAGGVALAGVTDTATLDALAVPGGVDCIVAPRLRDLADRLVDVPLALARGQAPRDAAAAVRALSGGSKALGAYRADYAAG